jgi:phospholipid/cholesterol/gamma-HCH transport system substrate-binding protein
MESKRLELKVGLFVFIGLVLLAVLLIAFSKGTSVFRGTYTVRMVASNVGGLKLRASVLLAGVQVGSVSAIKLAPDGKSVTITLNIYNGTTVYSDANFVIEQAGFLGDQYVAVIPTQNQAPVITNNEIVHCEPPFDMQVVLRSATGFIARVNDTVSKIEASVSQLQQTVLNEQTMTNLSIAVANLKAASDHANGVVGGLDSLVATNSEQVKIAVSNVVFFSHELTQLAANADGIIATNGQAISGAMTNLQATTATLRQIADDMRAGKGLAGTILENQELAANVQQTVNNLEVTTSNLNEFGLWHILWRHSTRAPPETNNGALKAPRQIE